MKKLIILDVNKVILLNTYPSKNLDQNAIIQTGRKVVYQRPYFREFLEFCKLNFDIAIWSCMQSHNLKPLLQSMFNKEDREYIKFVATQEDTVQVAEPSLHKKPIFLKELKTLRSKIENNYEIENVILIDDSPYKTCLNPFYSSLYPEPYMGQIADDFLPKTLIPYLKTLSTSSETMHKTIGKTYPRWSMQSLVEDWEVNRDVWTENVTVRLECDPEHRKRFNEFADVAFS